MEECHAEVGAMLRSLDREQLRRRRVWALLLMLLDPEAVRLAEYIHVVQKGMGDDQARSVVQMLAAKGMPHPTMWCCAQYHPELLTFFNDDKNGFRLLRAIERKRTLSKIPTLIMGGGGSMTHYDLGGDGGTVLQQLVDRQKEQCLATQGGVYRVTDQAMGEMLLDYYSKCPVCGAPLGIDTATVIPACADADEFINKVYGKAMTAHTGANPACHQGLDDTLDDEDHAQVDVELGVENAIAKAKEAANPTKN
jgi:hypothetical protein